MSTWHIRVRVIRVPDCDIRITRTKFGFCNLLPEIPEQNLGFWYFGFRVTVFLPSPTCMHGCRWSQNIECVARIVKQAQKILGKYFIGNVFFVEYFFWTLGKNFVQCRKALGKLRIKKSKKQKNMFSNYRNNCPTLRIILLIAL
jgi:hypothetical protein